MVDYIKPGIREFYTGGEVFDILTCAMQTWEVIHLSRLVILYAQFSCIHYA